MSDEKLTPGELAQREAEEAKMYEDARIRELLKAFAAGVRYAKDDGPDFISWLETHLERGTA